MKCKFETKVEKKSINPFVGKMKIILIKNDDNFSADNEVSFHASTSYRTNIYKIQKIPTLY